VPKDKEVAIWKDNDPTDEIAPNVLSSCVYNDEGRGAFPTLAKPAWQISTLNLMALAKKIPIKAATWSSPSTMPPPSRCGSRMPAAKLKPICGRLLFVDLNQYFNVAKSSNTSPLR